jgi:hypothetical protein
MFLGFRRFSRPCEPRHKNEKKNKARRQDFGIAKVGF